MIDKKTNKKAGVQKGHKGHCLSKSMVEEKIKKGEFKTEVIRKGDIQEEYISKYILDIKVDVIAKEYSFYKDESGKYNIPKEFHTDIQYGEELKTRCAILNTFGIVIFGLWALLRKWVINTVGELIFGLREAEERYIRFYDDLELRYINAVEIDMLRKSIKKMEKRWKFFLKGKIILGPDPRDYDYNKLKSRH